MHFLSAVWHFLTTRANWSGSNGITTRAIAQLELCAVVMVAAVGVGVAIGYWLAHRRHGAFLAVNAANAARAVPSLALITLLVIWSVVALKGNGFYASFLALVALAIPPILTNAYVAMREVDPDIKEAATAVGLSPWQRFVRVEIPLAAPLTIAGIRTAAIEVVATSTLAAFISYNDLGIYIFAGLNTNNDVESFSGALLVAVLAGATDLVLLSIYRLVTPAPLRARRAASRRQARVSSTIAPAR